MSCLIRQWNNYNITTITMKQLTDRQLDLRISALKKRLEQTATRDANLRHHLLQGETRPWTCAEMGELGGDAIEVKARVRFMGRSLPLPFED